MHRHGVLLASLFSLLAAAKPVPGSVNVPITDAEWAALEESGLQRRGDAASINQPITALEWQNLEAGGFNSSEDGQSLTKRDKVMNCGHTVTGDGGSGGHGKWIPVAQFSTVANEFCKCHSFTR